jgi:hypothetical protein
MISSVYDLEPVARRYCLNMPTPLVVVRNSGARDCIYNYKDCFEFRERINYYSTATFNIERTTAGFAIHASERLACASSLRCQQ